MHHSQGWRAGVGCPQKREEGEETRERTLQSLKGEETRPTGGGTRLFGGQLRASLQKRMIFHRQVADGPAMLFSWAWRP